MQRHDLLLVLSAFGFVLPACSDVQEKPAASGAALEGDPAYQSFLESKAFQALSPEVADEVKQALAAAPGPLARKAMLDLFKSVKWSMLGSATDAASCTSDGRRAQVLIANWVKATAEPQAKETPAAADARANASIDVIRKTLAESDVRSIDPTLSKIKERLGPATPPFTLDACGTSSSNVSSTSTGGGSTTGYTSPGPNANGNGPHAKNEIQIHSPAAKAILDEVFAEVAVETPSRGMVAEWGDLRSAYAKLRRGPGAQAVLREARRAGSATLARADGARAAARFDQAAGIVDQMVRANVRLGTSALTLVHSVVAEREPGQLRTAGQDVFRGRDRERFYLPGAEVAGAVDTLFADLQKLREDSVETPRIAAIFDQRMITVHPFTDANGRTTRLMTDAILARDGFPPVIGDRTAMSAAAFWQKSDAQERAVHLERVTQGMRRSVAILRAAV